MSDDDTKRPDDFRGVLDLAPFDVDGAHGGTRYELSLLRESPPLVLGDLAEACVRFVERALKVRMDYTPLTLPLLDHYLEVARETFSLPTGPSDAEPEGRDPLLLGDQTPSKELVCQAAGAYFGEVIRRRHPSWWRLAAMPSHDHRLEFHRLNVLVYPIHMVLDALLLDPERETGGLTGFELDPADREWATARLELLPEVTAEEFVRPSTRLEVLDILLDTAKGRAQLPGEPAIELEPEDYVN